MDIQEKLLAGGYPYQDSELQEALDYFKSKPIIALYKYLDGLCMLTSLNTEVASGGLLGCLRTSNNFSVKDFREEVIVAQTYDNLVRGLSYLESFNSGWYEKDSKRIIKFWKKSNAA
ncbi:hypothetical protein N9948_02060 [bacterium]|nr:hypothetical protein [bacterium]